ncbi:hypothetical protein THERMOS_946 [Bathymodiolus thermophilus thioautotrophic gill symbiont]|uniref:Uncharacterized protein n=1 Tax=Bathymodiolus thermophilus thioautotrophic gill symbiont TaxID=2360 RepID=A0A8H8XCZ8_9GAMM|nr:hypothetical protein THERMOS_946 [Bathymodiolus thermophilus thioautotrophic gill symbiont]
MLIITKKTYHFRGNTIFKKKLSNLALIPSIKPYLCKGLILFILFLKMV